MAKRKPLRGRSAPTPSQRSGIGCIILLAIGFLLLMFLLYAPLRNA